MLVLSRKQSQQIVIGRNIRITVVRIERSQVRLGIDAPDGVVILREELLTGARRDRQGDGLTEADKAPVRTI
jgi:carbon storage regulator